MPVCGQPRVSAFSLRPDMTHRLLSRVSTRKRVPKEPGEKFVRFPVVYRRHLARCDEQPYCGLFHVKRRLNTPSRVLLLKPEQRCTPCSVSRGTVGMVASCRLPREAPVAEYTADPVKRPCLTLVGADSPLITAGRCDWPKCGWRLSPNPDTGLGPAGVLNTDDGRFYRSGDGPTPPFSPNAAR